MLYALCKSFYMGCYGGITDTGIQSRTALFQPTIGLIHKIISQFYSLFIINGWIRISLPNAIYHHILHLTCFVLSSESASWSTGRAMLGNDRTRGCCHGGNALALHQPLHNMTRCQGLTFGLFDSSGDGVVMYLSFYGHAL
jgi:hypothetical protein